MEEGKRSGKRDEWTRNEESYREKAQSTRRHDSLRLFLNNNEMQSSWWGGSNYTPAIPQLTTATLLHLRHLWPLKTASSSYVYLPLVKASSLRSSSSSFLYSLLPRFSAERVNPSPGKISPPFAARFVRPFQAISLDFRWSLPACRKWTRAPRVV